MIRQLVLALAGLVFAAAVAPAAQTARLVETFDAAWTIVRDTHFDPEMNGVDWPAVRAELRPRAEAATTPAELRAVVREMLGRLGQSHFALIASESDAGTDPVDLSGDPGLDVRLVDGDLLVTSVDPDGAAASAGVRTGWKVVSIGPTTMANALARLGGEGALDRIVRVEAWRLAETKLRGPVGSSVLVMFENERGQPIRTAIDRREEKGQPVKIGNLPSMHVRVESGQHPLPGGGVAGLIRFNVWMPAVDAQFQEAIDRFRDADGIVLDLRGNPGGLAAMMMGISGHFLDERLSLGVMKTRETELRFVANPRLVSAAGKRVKPYDGPLAILVDDLTGSASECFAGGMQALGRARIFGRTSMGQALPALFDKLPNGDLLIHAYGDFVTANGTRLEGRGVVPDEPIPLSREDLLAGRDATLLAALRWISSESTSAPGSR